MTLLQSFHRILSEAVVRSYSLKKVFLEISQISRKNTGARDSFLILLKKSLLHRCFPVNFAKFQRTPFFYRTPPVPALVL